MDHAAHLGRLARRLVCQMAPVTELLGACEAVPHWSTLACQRALMEALLLDADCLAVSKRYRQRALKKLLDALKHEEIDEELLMGYLALKDGTTTGAAAGIKQDEEEKKDWYTLTFPLASRKGEIETTNSISGHGSSRLLRLRVRDHIGGGAETGCILWPAARLLTAYLLAEEGQGSVAVGSTTARKSWRQVLNGIHVLELGSGVGLPGLALAKSALPARVTLTDNDTVAMANLEENLNRNLNRNCSRGFDGGGRASGDESGRLGGTAVRIAPLDWYEVVAANEDELTRLLPEELAESQLIVCADLVYNPLLLAPLVGTLRRLLRRDVLPPPRASAGLHWPIALIAAERRSEETWAVFEDELKKNRLEFRDCTEEALAMAKGCEIHCSRESLDRMVVLELWSGATP